MDVDELEDITPDAVADARGSACPGPLLEAKKSIGIGERGRRRRDPLERPRLS